MLSGTNLRVSPAWLQEDNLTSRADSQVRTELETRLTHLQPAELLLPAKGLSKATEKVINHFTGATRSVQSIDELCHTDAKRQEQLEHLRPGRENRHDRHV